MGMPMGEMSMGGPGYPRMMPEMPIPHAGDLESVPDDHSVLKLSDGSNVRAADLEKILKKHLQAAEHVMVVGSGQDFLACIITLKTKGSEAVARGEDASTLGATQYDLTQEALELAQRHGSDGTTVQEVRQCKKFRGQGMLPLFAKANAEIQQKPQQVGLVSFISCISVSAS